MIHYFKDRSSWDFKRINTSSKDNLDSYTNKINPGSKGIVVGVDESGLYLIHVSWVLAQENEFFNFKFQADVNSQVKASLKNKNLNIANFSEYSVMNSKNYKIGPLNKKNESIKGMFNVSTCACDKPLNKNGIIIDEYKNNTTNCLSRICLFNQQQYLLSEVLLKNEKDSMLFDLESIEGFGYFFQDGDMVVSKEKIWQTNMVPLVGDINQIRDRYSEVLFAKNQLPFSLVVKFINIQNSNITDLRIINKEYAFV